MGAKGRRGMMVSSLPTGYIGVVNEDNPAFLYMMDETTGNPIDYSGNNIPSGIIDSQNMTRPGADELITGYTSTDLGTAQWSGAAVYANQNTFYQKKYITMETWWQPPTIPNNNYIYPFGYYESTTQVGFLIRYYFYSDANAFFRRFQLIVYNGIGQSFSGYTPYNPIINLNGPNYLVMQIAIDGGNECRFYLNNLKLIDFSNTITVGYYNRTDLSPTCNGFSGFANGLGQYAGFAGYHTTPLSETRMTAHYNAGLGV